MGDDVKDTYLVQPVAKALKVLELVASRGHDMSLAVISKELRLPKTTAFRYLHTLVEAGFVSHDRQHDRYGVGPLFRTIARADTNLNALRSMARPLMMELVQAFNETVNLGIEGHGQVIYLDIVEANRSLRMQARIGDRHPMHSTALGKAILAFLPEGERRAHLRGSLAERTGRTMIEIDEIERQLRQVARLGYATESGENEDGAMCISAPIVDESGYPIAAVSLSAPVQRMQRDLTLRVSERLVVVAAEVSGRLGRDRTW